MDSIFIKLTGNKDRHEMLDGFKFRPDLTTHFGATCPWTAKNDASNFSQTPLTRYLSNLQVTRTGINARNEFEFGPDRIIHFGVNRPWALNFFPIYLYWRKWCIHLFSVPLNSISIKLTGFEDRHKIADEFELRPDLINHFGVTCNGWWKNDVHFQSDLLQTCLQLEQHKISVEFKFQLNRTAGFAVKCHWVPKKILTERFYKQKPVLTSVPVPIVSTVPPKVFWNFVLYLYLELTVHQVSDCCPLGRLVECLLGEMKCKVYEHAPSFKFHSL